MDICFFPAFIAFLQILHVLDFVAKSRTLPVVNPITASCPVEELCPRPLFCHPISYEHETLTNPSLSAVAPSSKASFLSKAIFSRQLFRATFSTAVPISLSLLLNVTGLIVWTLSVENRLFRWVSPIPVWRQPRTAREFMLCVRGPRWPLLCPDDVFTLFFSPHELQRTVKTEASPNLLSSFTLYNDNGAEN